MSGGTADLNAAFAHCTRLARRTGRNFYWSFLTLPRPMRRDMGALYAFMRVTDDLGDDPAEPLDRRRAAVAEWRARTAAALVSEPVDPGEPHAAVLTAFADVARRRGIPAALPGDVIDGVAADLAGPPAVPGAPRVFFETDAGLDAYCYQVAGAVGLCCLHVWGCEGLDGAARGPALACGRAFQRTNVLRDLAEDAAAGRCYLPADTLVRFGVEPADFLPADGPLRGPGRRAGRASHRPPAAVRGRPDAGGVRRGRTAVRVRQPGRPRRAAGDDRDLRRPPGSGRGGRGRRAGPAGAGAGVAEGGGGRGGVDGAGGGVSGR